MDYLCQTGANSTFPSWLPNTCQGDWINVIISLFATYVGVLLIAYLKWMESNREPTGKTRVLRYHNLRACLALVLFLSHWAETADAFLSRALSHVFAVPFASIALWLVMLVLGHLVERTGRPVLLLVTASLWLVNGMARSLRFGMLCYVGVYADRLRSLTAAVCAVACYAIAGLEFLTARGEMNQPELEKSDDGHLDIQSYRYDDVHFFSRATFYWMNSLLKAGYKAPIELEDLGSLPPSHSAKQLHQRLERVMSQHKGEMTPAGAWKFFVAFMAPDFCIGGLFKLLGDLVGIVGPLGISVMVNFVAERKMSKEDRSNDGYPFVEQLWTNGWTAAFIVFFASIAQSTFSQASTHFVNVKGIHLRVALQSLMYKKSLGLRTSGGHGSQHGKLDEEGIDLGVMVNLMSNDATNVMSFFWIAHYIWAIPVKMAVIMFFLYLKLGVSAIIGAAGTILVLMPLQLSIGKRMSRNTSAILELSDERLQHLSILTDKIKLFKLLGWENYYRDRILEIRRKELEYLDRDSIFWAILTFFTHASSVLVSLTTFGVHYVFGEKPLTADSVFSTLALINQLMVPLFIFPVIIPKIAEAIVSCRRISEFFRLPEVSPTREVTNQKVDRKDAAKNFKMAPAMTSINEEDENRLSQTLTDVNLNLPEESEDEGNGSAPCCYGSRDGSDDVDAKVEDGKLSGGADWILTIEGGAFTWNPESPQKNLTVEKLTIPAGGIVVIIGKIGSGKSSLLSAILGEMPQTSGRFTWSRNISVAYCPQTPWLLNTTVRDNILFGLPFRRVRYNQVIAACALTSDLDILPKKDLTEIGEKGINLSGGQKQRIAIARALYSRANLVILDDPLSSLDLATAATIFGDGIKRLVRRCKRTVVLVTHNLQFLADCHLIIAMEDGKIREQGKPSDVRFSDCELLKNWKESSLAADNNALKEHSAKERWQLIKSVARFRRKSLRIKNADRGSCFGEDDLTGYLSAGKARKLLDEHSKWSYIAHDLPLPTDEFQNKMIDCPAPRRRSLVRRKEIGRASSLQARHIRTSQVVRQYSSPLSSDSNDQLRMQKNCRRELINHFLFTHSREGAAQKETARFKTPVCRLVSSESGVSDLFSDFGDEKDIEIGENFINKDVEEREYGKMRKKVYLTYLIACGIKTALAYLVVTLTWQVVRVNTDYWLSIWVETPATHGIITYLWVYAALSVGAVILSLVSHGLGQFAGSRARKKLHDSMLLNIVQCPIKLFECTPAGRIFNRFSADVEVIDKNLATTIQRLMQFLLLCCSSIVINAVITPWFIVVTIPMVLLYYIIQMFYRCSSRELQRIDSITRSPIFSHFTETLSGLSSIRAFGYEETFLSSFHTKLNLNTNSFLILNSTNRWLGIVLDYLGSLIVLLAMVTALIAVQLYPDSITPSLVGLAMNYTLLVPTYLNWVVKFFADCEIYLGAVERITEYTTLPTEKYNPPSAIEVVPSDCLKSGDIKFENVTLSYGSSTEPALVGINLHIPPGQKIGICGRSGSGKSTLALSLFNMLEIHEGVIQIDGVDITKIPLHLLRTTGSIIPQDALLFNGTVRENLDAPGLCTDEELWSAIGEAHLREIIEAQYHGNLDSEMNAGQSLSGGEKQLFSLARAILQKSSFLIMDEATSNLDKESEQVLMSTAQKVFKGKTLLIIASCKNHTLVQRQWPSYQNFPPKYALLIRLAEKFAFIALQQHRLSTVLDCDRIIVLDRGRIVEDGPPSCLTNRQSGIFSAMVKSSEEGFLVP